MKNVLIYDVAAEKTGAAVVLRKYYEMYSRDEKVNCYFVTSVLDYPENYHTKIIKLPWVKKSRVHRLYCDNIYVRKIIKKYNIDEVINLQNIALRGLHIPQTVYLHNAIPITNIDFDFKQEKSLWLFKHVVSRIILKNLKYANSIIVQADWIKKELNQRFAIEESKIIVERFTPVISGENSRVETDNYIFFYPANLCSYKNHESILLACELLKEEGYANFEVVFTFCPEDGDAQKRIFERVKEKGLPIKFVGLLNQEEMADMYRKSILIFPSYLETVGLPLIEAQYYNAEMVVVDLPYARESIGKYKRVKWFNRDNFVELKKCMIQLMN